MTLRMRAQLRTLSAECESEKERARIERAVDIAYDSAYRTVSGAGEDDGGKAKPIDGALLLKNLNASSEDAREAIARGTTENPAICPERKAIAEACGLPGSATVDEVLTIIRSLRMMAMNGQPNPLDRELVGEALVVKAYEIFDSHEVGAGA
ncbi:hypothetical protein EON81_26020 [bacterium]|nr:MAG: hypothetical protein EON81_26020 [bacterium]